MPINSEWVEPEELLTHKDVTVWLTYKDDDVNQGARSCWYTMDVLEGEDSDSPAVFDIRDLSTYAGDTDGHHESSIRQAIDAGELTTSGITEHEKEDTDGSTN